MPAILEAVESNATVGEIAASMRKVFGEYRATQRTRCRCVKTRIRY